MTSVMQGMKVVDCTQWIAGPRAGAFLAYLGADVIHVERRGLGDAYRGIVRMMGRDFELQGVHLGFESVNNGKRDIALDLQKQKGKQILYELVETADVFLTNLRPKAVSKLGLDYATLSQLNPRLIYASSSAFGLKGPDRDAGAWDGVAQARSGLTWYNRDQNDRPNVIPGAAADQITGIVIALSILSALLARERHGIGQEVNASMLGALIHLYQREYMGASLRGAREEQKERELGERAGNPIYNTYRCKDGKWMLLGLQDSETYWSPFCKAAGIAELEKDPRFVDMYKREENNVELISILEEVFATKTLDEWSKICKENDFNFAPCQTFREVLTDVNALANEYIVEIDHPVFGKVKSAGHPFHLSKTPGTVANAAPQYGEHTEEVLLELGYTWDDITDLRNEEVI